MSKGEIKSIREAIATISKWDNIKKAGCASLPAGNATVSFKKMDGILRTVGTYMVPVGELVREGTVAFFATVQMEGDRQVAREICYYNLDVIISVGYRVKSKRGTQFRIWATLLHIRMAFFNRAYRCYYGRKSHALLLKYKKQVYGVR